MFTKILEDCMNEDKAYFLGTCKNVVDPEDMEEVSALANIVDDGEEVSKDEFLAFVTLYSEHAEMLNSDPDNFEFYINREENVAWFYDIDEDVEYFYGYHFPMV